MSRGKEPTKNVSVQVRALVNRQVQAWETHDFAVAADDWLPNGEWLEEKSLAGTNTSGGWSERRRASGSV
jgi:hypothetical protein